MKKAGFILVTTLLILTSQAFAQRKTPPFQFGFRFAPNIGWLKPDAEEYKGDGVALGYSWGFVGEYKFSDNYSICSGFSIPMNGGKLKYPYASEGDTGTMNRKYKFKAIEIPVLLKMQTKEIGYFSYFMQMGFATSINISAKAKDEFEVYYPDAKIVKKEPNIKSSTRFLRESMIIGVGAQYNLSGSTQIFGSLSFDNGFTNVLKVKNPITKQSEDAISNYLELSFGILF
jgi:hypothetical protein